LSQCFATHHSKYRVTVWLVGKLSAYRLSGNNMPVWQLAQYYKLFLGRQTSSRMCE
jgi:hypothetical protein